MKILCAWASAPAIVLGALCMLPGAVPPSRPKNVPPSAVHQSSCVACHQKIQPGIVNDWKLSRHAQIGVDCTVCHGDAHRTATDFEKARIPTADTCGSCHPTQTDQFKEGKHAHGWSSMKAMPTFHYQPMALTEGMKGCGGCHKVGLKTEEEIRQLAHDGNRFGIASCDGCHTRHTFAIAEARQPQACQTCHMGFDHPQWEMYSASKHGVRHGLKQNRIVHASASAPTCQTCHMIQGNHKVRTAWSFLGVRLPLPEDKEWAEDQATIMMALGILAPDGKPTPRLEIMKKEDIIRTDPADWQKERGKMTAICSRCHSGNFARGELAKGDKMIREADRLMAQAVRIVAALYQDGTLKKPQNYPYPFPDLLTYHDAPTVIEQRLFLMFFEHRMRTFQGTFHSNPDYALWYGWSEMQLDLTEIKAMAEDLRLKHGGRVGER